MFKNNIFKVDLKEWAKKTAIRCIRTFASTAISLLPTTAATLGSINWSLVFSCSVTSTIIILLTCLAGIPEVTKEE